MKTPMQKLKELVLRHREYNLINFQESTGNSEIDEAKLFLCDDILDGIDSYLMQEEKDCIIAAYEFGWTAGAINQGPVDSKTHQEGEDFYNKTFNQ